VRPLHEHVTHLRELTAAVDGLGLTMPPQHSALCHAGITTQAECAHCQRIARVLRANADAKAVMRG
jgi:hypothetical protein